ncbi:MAG TPA: transaldolase [Gemmatimonadales bacterium]|nr:transaldolase [Gemmatimonadales bacterium]
MSTKNPLVRLTELGQSPWYDFITRDLFTSGTLQHLIDAGELRGMTSNPTIFEKAVSKSDLYDEDIRRLSREGRTPAQIFEAIAVADVRSACDLFRPLYDKTNGGDGLVSIEVSPGVAFDTQASINEARRLWHEVDRPNAMVKIPGTEAGLEAIRQCLTEGININITLLFSVQRYDQVREAFLSALEARVAKGQPIDRLASVASFFVSRVDTKVDKILDKQGDPDKLRGTIAIANAAQAYAAFEATFDGARWAPLEAKGAQRQRPLWASTSTKDPKYPDIYYVEALIAPDTVDTIPPATLDAYRDHGDPKVRIREAMARAPEQLRQLARSGIDLAQVTAELEKEGVEKFAASYDELLAGIEHKAGELAAR